MNPWFLFCLIVPCVGCPFRDDDNRKVTDRNYELAKENSRLRKIMIENGINYGGSIYVEGQKP